MADAPTIDPALLRQIQNTVNDLRSTDYPSFERHIRKLARLLHAPGLNEISEELAKEIDLESWLRAGAETMGSMVGSARLEWPADHTQQLGTFIRLIDKFAQDPDWAVRYFAFVFCYLGSDLASNLQNMADQIIVPFARDYIEYVSTDATQAREDAALPERSAASGKVFVVHGYDGEARESVARFLLELDLKPIILHEQPNQGRTIIEKVEDHGDVGFAVVLLTADDVGGPKDGQMQPRPRQNVLLELGYFIGRLGRARVCALKRGEMEFPTDFAGVVWEPFDGAAGSWKQRLGRELQAAGFEIDWNKVMQS